jgi:signal transduction histidine kinase/ActR/RegA family two-component response regulator
MSASAGSRLRQIGFYFVSVLIFALVLWAEIALDLFPSDNRAKGIVFGSLVSAWVVVLVVRRMVNKRIDEERAATAEAERSARQARRLAQTTAALGQVRTSAEAIEATIQEPLHWLGGDAGVLLLLSEDRLFLTPARAVGYAANISDSWRLDTFGAQSPMVECMNHLVPVVVESAKGLKPEYTAWWNHHPWHTHEASLVLPISVERRPIAFLQVDFSSPQVFTTEDYEYLEVLGSRAAQAIARTRRHESVERARVDAESLKARADAELIERQKTELALRASETRYRALATRTTRLHALTSSLSEAATVTAVAQAILEQAHIIVGASEANLELVSVDLPAPERGLCSTEVLKSRRAVFVSSIVDLQEKFWRSASFAADRGFSSLAALPLLAEGKPIGVLEFHFAAPVNFDEEYQALLVSVAQHCSQALYRARLYEQAQRARADAEAANRLKDEFVSTVSHELRTPLNAILGWASMLKSGTVAADVVPQALESVHRNALRQAKLVDDLLDFSRMASGRVALDLETLEVGSLIRGVVESIGPLAVSSQVDIELLPIPEAAIRGDVRRLEQVFLNLLGNSLKFTPPGGHITVSAASADHDLEIRVADDGVGIAADFLPHVFDRFRQGDSTTTRNHSGLGLGLSIAKQLIEAHKGTIRVESAGSAKGTVFIVTLPVAGRPADARRDAVLPEDLPRLDGVRVLVVDDEKDARDLIGRALSESGAEITLADSSQEAFEILEHNSIDVLLADIAMPGEDGYSLIRRIRSSDSSVRSIPAAAVTAHALDDERSKALAAGFHRHVAKPIEPFEIVRLVRQLAHDKWTGVPSVV